MPASETLQSVPDAEYFRALERARTRALVERDMPRAWALHAPDYQLITPAGKPFDRDGYLAAIESGDLQYVEWQCGEMQVRISPAMAMLRYQARLVFPSGKVLMCWHTDAYELRDGAWQAVWSQATGISGG